MDNEPSDSPVMNNGTEAKFSPSASPTKNKSKKATDRHKPIFFIFQLIFDAVIPNLIAYVM